jgi:hypothetical protein
MLRRGQHNIPLSLQRKGEPALAREPWRRCLFWANTVQIRRLSLAILPTAASFTAVPNGDLSSRQGPL